MKPTATPSFGIKFPSRKERSVKRVTKCETREIQKRLEPPKPARVRPPPKPKTPKSPKPPATLSKPLRTRRDTQVRSNVVSTTPKPSKELTAPASRTLQAADLEKLARINCSREFSLFNQCVKSDLSKAFENQLAFLQTKVKLLKNEFDNRQAEHLNFEQIKKYYNQVLAEHKRRQITSEEYMTMSEKFRQDIKQAIDKWLRRKEFKPPRQVTFISQRRHELVREKVKETIHQQNLQKQQSAKQDNHASESKVTMAQTTVIQPPTTVTIDDDDDIMIIE